MRKRRDFFLFFKEIEIDVRCGIDGAVVVKEADLAPEGLRFESISSEHDIVPTR